jgi:hypothetical protein
MSDVRVFFIWVSAQDPAVDHAVTDEEMAARNTEGRGDYRAVCGVAFLPAPDDQPPYSTCPACVAVLPQPLRRRRNRKRGCGAKRERVR